MTPRVALVTYSTKPRGGVVHTLALAEALSALGSDVTVIALSDPTNGSGFYRPTSARHVLIPGPPRAARLEDRVFRAVDSLAEGLAGVAGQYDILHAQDCIAGRAAVRVRDGGMGIPVVRTVHHVDDFTTSALIDCQRQAIIEPDRLLVVSDYWLGLLRRDYGVEATVVHNGVDASRFGAPAPLDPAALRRGAGVGDDRFVFLAVGGIEPRKGSIYLLEALAQLKQRAGPSPVLAVIGGHSFQDYREYRERALDRLPELGLQLGTDVLLLGTVCDDELATWYRSADALAFPSVKEGWGLAVLEAMSAGLPVIATDIPVFREYLTHRQSALLVPAADSVALAGAMEVLMADAGLRDRLRRQGPRVAARYTWPACARDHIGIYEQVKNSGANLITPGTHGD